MTATAALGTSAFFVPALNNLSDTQQKVALNVAQLSSGNRLVYADTDSAALSISSQLQSQLSGVRSAQTNAVQGNSFLQVAAGGLQQIQSLLNTLQGLAVQANSAALTTLQREQLQQQFQASLDSIDSIAGSTTFNGIHLLDGTVPGPAAVGTTSTNATKASATLTFSDLTGVETVTLNGVTFTGAGANTSTTFDTTGGTNTAVGNLATVLNSSTDRRISQATYSSNGAGVLTITQKAGGTAGNQYVIDKTASTSTFAVTGGSTQVATTYTLTGGADNGLNAGSVQASGTIGNGLLTAQSQSAASVSFTVTSVVDNDKLRIDNGTGGYADFTFKNSAAGASQIQIGSTVQETLQNAIEKLSQYSGTDNFGVRQLDFRINDDALVITAKQPGNATRFDGSTALSIATTAAGATLSAASFNNGTNAGVNTSGVMNAAFAGTITDGFSATYNSADNVTAQITVGSSTYSATITDTTPASNTIVRFSSTGGGYFDVQLATGGLAVANQSGANTYAASLNTAISGLNFTQNRTVSSFSGTGGLTNATAQIRLDDFTSPEVQDISVAAPVTEGGDAQIDITVGGHDFRSASGMGGSLGKYESITLTNVDDSSQSITLTLGATANDLSSDSAASTFEGKLRTAFGLNATSNAFQFQIGSSPDDTIAVTIGNSATSGIFASGSPDVSSQADAALAEDAITVAQGRVGTLLAGVSALQGSFNSALGNLQSTQTGVSQAFSALADTNIAETSTEFAINTVKLNAAAAVIAQTYQLQNQLVGILKRAAA